MLHLNQVALNGTLGDNGPLADDKTTCGADKHTVATDFYWHKLLQ